MSDIAIGLATIFCLMGVTAFILTKSCDRIQDKEIANGLKYTLILSGIWSFLEGMQVLILNANLFAYIHIITLIVGIICVFSWLYFASAFSNSTYHKDSKYRIPSLVILLSIILVKVTNPIHSLYFNTDMQSSYEHMHVEYFVIHDFVTVFAYVCAFIGSYFVYRGLKMRTSGIFYPISLFISITIPSVASLAMRTDILLPSISGIALDPIGLILLSIIVLSLKDRCYDQFYVDSRSNFLNNLSGAVIIVDDNTILDFNSEASRLFDLNESDITDDIQDVTPINEGFSTGDVINKDHHFYELNLIEYSHNGFNDSTAIFVTDKTDLIHNKIRVDRQNIQFEDLANGISHEIRNGLQIIQGHSEVVGSEELTSRQQGSIDTINRTTNRLDRVVEDLRSLASMGNQTFDLEKLNPEKFVESKGQKYDIDVRFDGEGFVIADKFRFQKLVNKSIEFAVETNATWIEFKIDENSLYISQDGDGISEGDFESAIEYGEAVPSAETGSILPVVKTVCETHGWSITENKQTEDVLRYRISGVNHGNISNDTLTEVFTN